MKVIGAGYGRTGTLSLKTALEILGFEPAYHMQTVLARPDHRRKWEAIFKGEAVEWDELFGEFEASTDYPACIFYKELAEKYPDAKVVLTVRDPERWYASTADTIFKMSYSFPFFARLVLFPIAKFQDAVNRMIWENYFNGRFSDKAYAIEKFKSHNEEVKATMPADRLLVYEVKEGWEPLCEFLGVPVPDEPFPNVNDRETMQQRIQIVQILGKVVPAVLLVIAITFLLIFR